MTNKPLRPCRYPGCYALVPDGYCPAHQPAPGKEDRRSDEAKAYRWMYRTDVWTKDLRIKQLCREPWCRECAKLGRRVRATDVDHIVDHKGSWELFADENNLQSLCHNCHSRKTAADQLKNKLKRRRR